MLHLGHVFSCKAKGFIFVYWNGVLLLLCSRTNSESQCGKVIHKKSVGRAGNSNFLNFPLSPLIFYVLLSRIDFQSSSVAFLSRKPHSTILTTALDTQRLIINQLLQAQVMTGTPQSTKMSMSMTTDNPHRLLHTTGGAKSTKTTDPERQPSTSAATKETKIPSTNEDDN